MSTVQFPWDVLAASLKRHNATTVTQINMPKYSNIMKQVNGLQDSEYVLKEENTTLRESLELSIKTVSAGVATEQKLQETITELNHTITELKNTCTKLNNDLTLLNEENTSLKEKVAKYDADVSKLEKMLGTVGTNH